MTMSLVICTRNRADRLAQCFDALRALTPPPGFELVAVDNGSTDQTHSALAALEAPYPIRIVSEPTPGLARARNTGWRASSGDLIAFTDDDCYVSRDYATEVEALFAAYPEIGFFGGRVLLHNSLDHPITIKESAEEQYFPERRFLAAGTIHGANFGFRREVLEKLGGFDNRLGAGTAFPCEDIELAGRALAAGWPGIYSPGPTVRHDHGRRLPDEIRTLMRGYDLGSGAYYISMFRQDSVRWQAVRHWLRRSMALTPRKCLRRIRRASLQVLGALQFLMEGQRR
jgi:GT2 family glycosyltransferase